MKRAMGAHSAIDAQAISFEQGALVCEPGDLMRYVYFPLSCVLSALSSHRDGTIVATTLRGYEGGFGLLTAIRKAKTNARCQVQIGGPALRVDAKQLGSIFDGSKEIRHVFLCYWDAVMFQYEQTGVCNTKRAVSSRLSRCLLEIHDRVIGDAFPFTHQHMANLIAANRTTVSLAMSALDVLALSKRIVHTSVSLIASVCRRQAAIAMRAFEADARQRTDNAVRGPFTLIQ